MKKNSKNNRKKIILAQLSALAQREPGSLVIGIDLGDRRSTYCVRTRLDSERIAEGELGTDPQAVVDAFGGLRRQRIVMETGTHSPWMARLLELMGHEVVVGNSRKLKLITENQQKSDKVDSRLLSKMGCVGLDWLHAVYRRGEEAQNDLTLVRAREGLIAARTALINQVRGMVKSFGCRLKACGSEQFVEVAREGMPPRLQSAMRGLLAILEELNEQIYAYDCEIQQLCATKYEQETQRLMQVSGIGPLTALTFRLTIEDAGRFERSRDVGPYLGLTPARRQSGSRDPQLGITKAGDELLRKLLVNCAQHMLGRHGQDSDLRRWGLGLVEAGQRAGKQGARKRAAAAVARKLAVLLHRLWVSGEEYDPLRQQKRQAAVAA